VPEVVKGNTAFALDLYQQLKDRPGNLFFSPHSISSALAMTYAGARGQTEKEMAKALHFSLPQEGLHAAFSTLAAQLYNVQSKGRVALTVANSLWCQQSYHFEDAFLNLTRKQYRAETRLVDFKHSAEAARSEINTWVERRTNEKIKDLIRPHLLSADTRLVLCNAVYFKGKWALQFDPKRTESAPFFTSPDNSLPVPMMWQKSNFKMLDAGDVSLLEMPYAGDDLSMIVLLPKAVDGLPALERQLDTDSLGKWIAKLGQAHAGELSVWLPKFKTTCSFELAKELADMGMPSAFNMTADFSGMTGTRDLFISDVVHKAFVEVNEEGTEAAAATGVVMAMKGIMSRPRIFKADHPFLFLIRENQNGSILFLGRIADPTK
jgi:serpin B